MTAKIRWRFQKVALPGSISLLDKQGGGDFG